MRLSNWEWLHTWVAIAAVGLAIITSYYPSSIDFILRATVL